MAETYLVSLALDSGQGQDHHFPGEQFLIKFVPAVFNGWIQVNDLVGNAQLVDNILQGEVRGAQVSMWEKQRNVQN